MGEYAPRTIEESEYYKILDTLRSGFTDPAGVEHRPNKGAAMALLLEANTGLRIVDILKLTQGDIKKNGDTWQLDIIEQKTGKKCQKVIPEALKEYIDAYCIENNINDGRRIVPTCERNIQKLLKACCSFLCLSNVSTHSFRRFGGLNVYRASGNDITVAQQYYNHSNPQTTYIYLKKSADKLDKAIADAIRI